MVAAGPPLSSFLLPTPLDQELLQGGDSLRQPQPPSTWGQDSQRRHLDTGSRSHHPQGHVGGLGSRDGEEPEPGKWSHVLASQMTTYSSLSLTACSKSLSSLHNKRDGGGEDNSRNPKLWPRNSETLGGTGAWPSARTQLGILMDVGHHQNKSDTAHIDSAGCSSPIPLLG